MARSYLSSLLITWSGVNSNVKHLLSGALTFFFTQSTIDSIDFLQFKKIKYIFFNSVDFQKNFARCIFTIIFDRWPHLYFVACGFYTSRRWLIKFPREISVRVTLVNPLHTSVHEASVFLWCKWHATLFTMQSD